MNFFSFVVMAPTLYMTEASPPVRAVLMTVQAIGLKFEKKILDFFYSEHLTPAFRQLNPQHTVPTLGDDDGFTIWDSHAIMVYLVSKYAKNNDLYPQDVKKRAIINQRLFFDSGVPFFLMKRIAQDLVNVRNTVDQRDKQSVIEGYSFLEQFLQCNKWVSGDSLSIADYSLVTTVTTLDMVVPIDYEMYPNMKGWLRRCEALPEYEANRKGIKAAAKLLLTRLAK